MAPLIGVGFEVNSLIATVGFEVTICGPGGNELGALK
jgi:hypothetical protein